MPSASVPIATNPSTKRNEGIAAFSPTLQPLDQLPPHAATSISSPNRASAVGSLSPNILGSARGTVDDGLIGLGLGSRTNSTDDLDSDVVAAPVNTVSEARLLYRQWRTGSLTDFTSLDIAGTSPNKPQQPTFTGRSPDRAGLMRNSSTGSFVRSPELPRISEKLLEENVPLFANSFDPDLQARLLSEKLTAEDAEEPPPVGRPQGGSVGKANAPSDTNNSNLTMKKARSYQALADLEKKGYFPSAPKPSAIGVQRGLKDSVVNDMCRAVVKHMVGDVYVNSSGQYGSKKVLNHLYEPVLQSVQNHFKRLPARYALSVDPDDVPMHMRLLARHTRNPNEISVNAQLKKDDDGEALTGMKGSIMDADVMTTHDGVTLDRFVVRGMFMTEYRQQELKRRIEENLTRLSLGDNFDISERPSVTSRTGSANASEANESDDANLAEKLGVLKMVDQNEIKDEWRLNLAEIRLEKPVGLGRSGQTYSAWWRGTRVAAKVVDASAQNGAISDDLLNEFYREVAVVSKLRHPNVVLFLGAAVSPPRYCLVFEYMQNGTLTDLIRARKSPIDFFRIAREIAMGMNYLHLCSIMHRDLKSGNVLLDAHGTVKISDFGLSCVLEMGYSSDLTAETGTYRWMAPEVIRHEPYSNKADVYSFGVVLWEMIAKDQPFRGLTPIQAAFAVARQQMRPALPRHTPLKIGELVEHCWHQDPARRPNFADILEALPLVQMSLKKRDLKNLGFALPG
ncbi:TPA: hypothetical protein N0F65_009963 [Lagenidium giganteum]|uniref:Protein kinase domain-containing protein n=1 Tax=Lagenidium giganteum TaxID=4803 RepID=A0AAV2YTY8_9STRA|nr:TPA: hypothetical protein N0F65_009963 [Lagenidium giganteum]